MHTNYRIRVLMGILLLSVGAPLANAEPQKKAEPQNEAELQKDTALAEKSYRNGDLVYAMALWRKAAEQGYAPAQVRLADTLDVSEEDKEAVMWYQKAAAQGNSAGEYGLGLMYLRGEGIEKNEEKGRSLILQAANKNYMNAMRLMMDSYKTGIAGLPVDLEQAGIWEDKIYAVLGIPKPVLAPATAPVPDVKKKK